MKAKTKKPRVVWVVWDKEWDCYLACRKTRKEARDYINLWQKNVVPARLIKFMEVRRGE